MIEENDQLCMALFHPHFFTLMERVREEVNDGWKLDGEPFITDDRDFCQRLVKKITSSAS